MDKVEEFIKRRFPIDSHFLDMNCYYFSLILKDRFPEGKVYYEVIFCHFIFYYEGKYYDWTGEINPRLEKLVEWDKFDEYDKLQKQVVIRDCVM